MIVGGYQISNALVAILLVASTTGAGVATDSFSGLDDFTTPLSDPSENITDVNETETDDSQDSSGEGTQDSSSDGSSDSDSGDSGGSDQDSPDSSDDNNQQDPESEDSSDEEGGFLDNILGNEEENSTQENSTDDSVDQVDDTENVTDDNTTGTGTEGTENDTDSTQNDTTTAEITSFSAPRDSQFYDPYESTSVPLEAELTGNNVEYEVVLNGETNTAGSFSGTETINTSLTLSDTGSHEITLEITQSGSTVNSITRTFEIADSAIQQTGFSKTTTIRTGSEAGFRLLDNGEPVEDASISLDGTQTANTNADGEFTVQVPYQDTIKLSTGYSGIPGQEFNVTQDIPEPETTLIGPNDLDSFDTPTGTNRDVTFEASVEITEDSGTASLVIDGSEAYTQDLTSGTNSISTTQALSGGTHNWQVEVDTPEHKVSSSSRSLTVNEQEVQNGLSLQNNATAGEYNYVRLYDSGEPVEGAEITVNGDSIGTTDSNGEVGFEVPNTQEITVSASGYSDITRTVDGYTEEIDMGFSFSDTIYQGRSNTLTVTDQGSGDALNGATVYANGVEQGQTDSSGQITFTVPEENSVTVKAVKDNSDDNKSFTAEVPPLRVSVISPKDGQSFGSYKASFNLEVNSTSQGNLDISIDGTNKLSESLSSGQNTFTNDFVLENSGTHDFTISISNQEESRQITGTFNTAEDVPAPTIFVDTPTEGQAIGDSRANILTSFDSVDPFDYNIDVNNRNIDTGSLQSGNPSVELTAYCLPSQQHDIEITATSQDTGASSTETVSFETTGTPPVVAKDNSKPTRGDTLQSPVTFNYTVVGCQDSVNYDVYVEQGGSTVQTIDSGTLGKFEKVKAPDTSFSLSSGDYTFVMAGQNQISLSFSVQ